MAELNDILSDDSLRYLSEIKPVIRKKYNIDVEEKARIHNRKAE